MNPKMTQACVRDIDEDKRYSFEELEKMSDSEVLNIKKQKLDALASARQKKWNDISAILFYQNELERINDR